MATQEELQQAIDDASTQMTGYADADAPARNSKLTTLDTILNQTPPDLGRVRIGLSEDREFYESIGVRVDSGFYGNSFQTPMSNRARIAWGVGAGLGALSLVGGAIYGLVSLLGGFASVFTGVAMATVGGGLITLGFTRKSYVAKGAALLATLGILGDWTANKGRGTKFVHQGITSALKADPNIEESLEKYKDMGKAPAMVAPSTSSLNTTTQPAPPMVLPGGAATPTTTPPVMATPAPAPIPDMAPPSPRTRGAEPTPTATPPEMKPPRRECSVPSQGDNVRQFRVVRQQGPITYKDLAKSGDSYVKDLPTNRTADTRSASVKEGRELADKTPTI